jgi:hypothetical protein
VVKERKIMRRRRETKSVTKRKSALTIMLGHAEKSRTVTTFFVL